MPAAEDFTNLTTGDHNRVRELYQYYQHTSPGNTEQREKLANSIIRELALHSVTEEVGTALVFHTSATVPQRAQDLEERVVYALDKAGINDSNFDATLQKIIGEFDHQENMRTHLTCLGCVKQMNADEAVKLAESFNNMKALVPTHPHASAANKGGVWESVVGLVSKPIDKLWDATRQFA
ncbi:hypothetical protein BJ742DRAFT_771221 [Cladochytrium replicatum]|nr:hypothetical protein BJ742DRAFT_771221 [Cladochytrium replicatum]